MARLETQNPSMRSTSTPQSGAGNIAPMVASAVGTSIECTTSFSTVSVLRCIPQKFFPQSDPFVAHCCVLDLFCRLRSQACRGL